MGGAARYSPATASSPGLHDNLAHLAECPAGARNQLRVHRRNRDALAGPACRAYPAYLVGLAVRASLAGRDDPGDLASRVDRACPADPACQGAMARPAARGDRVYGRGRANGGRARAGRDSRPCRRMR